MYQRCGVDTEIPYRLFYLILCSSELIEAKFSRIGFLLSIWDDCRTPVCRPRFRFSDSGLDLKPWAIRTSKSLEQELLVGVANFCHSLPATTPPPRQLPLHQHPLTPFPPHTLDQRNKGSHPLNFRWAAQNPLLLLNPSHVRKNGER